MKTVTLPEYRGTGWTAPWVKADCDHKPGVWCCDPTQPRYVEPFRYVTNCQRCGKTLHAEGTAWGKITKKIGW